MTAELPGLTVEVVPPPEDLPPPLRTDVAGFLGATRRGPLGEPVRVEGLTGYRDLFGDLDSAAATSYAVRGYFENGGELAWVVRVGGTGTPATAEWSVADLTGFPATGYRVVATQPGDMGRRRPGDDLVPVGQPGRPTRGRRPGGGPRRAGGGLHESPGGGGHRAAGSLAADPAGARDHPGGRRAGPSCAGPPVEGHRAQTWRGADAAPGLDDYLAAVETLADQPEVAIVAAPDLGGHLTVDADRQAVVTALLDTAASRLDRLVLLDVPAGEAGHTPGAGDALAWATTMLPDDPVQRRAGAVYHPRLLVPDPLGGPAAPLRAVPPSGHVAGVISRLDRERGAYHTPANAVLDDAVDLDPALTEPSRWRHPGRG